MAGKLLVDNRSRKNKQKMFRKVNFLTLNYYTIKKNKKPFGEIMTKKITQAYSPEKNKKNFRKINFLTLNYYPKNHGGIVMSTRQSEKRHSQFTLIELMIIISIIAILAAMLLPALNKAKEKAHYAACVGKLHQIGKAYSMYFNDWQDQLPGEYNVGILAQENYMISKGGKDYFNQFWCPAELQTKAVTNFNYTTTYWVGRDRDAGSPYPVIFRKVSSIRKPSIRIVVTGVAPSGGPASATSHKSVKYRHSGNSGNYLWLDMHVEPRSFLSWEFMSLASATQPEYDASWRYQ